MNKLLKNVSILAIIAGILLTIGGAWGIAYTYKNVAREKIVTPEDSALPNQPVRGPLTLKAQGDIIREHTLKISGGKTYAEMPRQTEKLDSAGKPVLDGEGKTVMVDNAARNIWVTATTLATALNLAMLSYAFSAVVFIIGILFILFGFLFLRIAKIITN